MNFFPESDLLAGKKEGIFCGNRWDVEIEEGVTRRMSAMERT